MASFGALFAARTDIYAVRWENARTGRAGWLPAVRGGWRKGIPHAEREYLPLTAEVLAVHRSGKAARLRQSSASPSSANSIASASASGGEAAG